LVIYFGMHHGNPTSSAGNDEDPACRAVLFFPAALTWSGLATMPTGVGI
jgi:hypothetical protein